MVVMKNFKQELLNKIKIMVNCRTNSCTGCDKFVDSILQLIDKRDEYIIGEDDIVVGSPTDEMQHYAIEYRNNVRKMIRQRAKESLENSNS